MDKECQVYALYYGDRTEGRIIPESITNGPIILRSTVENSFFFIGRNRNEESGLIVRFDGIWKN